MAYIYDIGVGYFDFDGRVFCMTTRVNAEINDLKTVTFENIFDSADESERHIAVSA